EHLEPTVGGAGPVLGDPAGVAMGAQHLQLVLDAELLQHHRRGLGLLLVGGRAERDPNPWRHGHSLIRSLVPRILERTREAPRTCPPRRPRSGRAVPGRPRSRRAWPW